MVVMLTIYYLTCLFSWYKSQMYHPRLCKLIHVMIIFAALLSLSVSEDNQKQFGFTWQALQYTVIIMPESYVNSLTLCYNIVIMWILIILLFH